MTAKEAKEKSNKAYFEIQEKRLNDKIKSVNDAIEERKIDLINSNNNYKKLKKEFPNVKVRGL